MAALLELDRHLGQAGWDQPTRLFALVRTDELAVAEPGLAARAGAADLRRRRVCRTR